MQIPLSIWLLEESEVWNTLDLACSETYQSSQSNLAQQANKNLTLNLTAGSQPSELKGSLIHPEEVELAEDF
jgi:hypothetical protein